MPPPAARRRRDEARAFALSAAVLLAAGCGGAGRAPVFDAIARALPPLAGESKSEVKDESKNESPSAPSSAPANAPTAAAADFIWTTARPPFRPPIWRRFPMPRRARSRFSPRAIVRIARWGRTFRR